MSMLLQRGRSKPRRVLGSMHGGGGMEDKQLDVLAVYWHKDEGEQCVGRDRSTERQEQRGRQFVEGIS